MAGETFKPGPSTFASGIAGARGAIDAFSKASSDQLAKAKGGVDGLADAFSAAAGPVAGLGKTAASAFGEAFEKVGELSGKIQSLTALTGAASSTMQGLVHSVGLAGVGSSELAGELTGLSSRMYSVTTGSVGAILAFSRLGVTVGQSGGGFRNAADVYDEAIVKLIGIKNSVERAGKALDAGLPGALSTANRALQRSGGNIASAIKYYRESQAAVAAFGAELSGPAQTAIADYGDATSKLGLFFQGLKNAAVEPLYLALARTGERLTDLAKKNAAPLQGTFRRSGEALAALAPHLDKLAELGIQASPAVEKISVALAGVGNAVGTVFNAGAEKLIKVFGDLGFAGTAAGFAIFAAFFPLTAIFAGIALALDDFIGYQKGVPSVTGDAVAAFQKLRDEFNEDPDSQPPILKAVIQIGDAIEKAYQGAKKLTDYIFSNKALQALDRAAGVIEYAVGANKGSARYQGNADRSEAFSRLSVSERLGASFGGAESSAKLAALQEQIRQERRGGQSPAEPYPGQQSLPPSADALVSRVPGAGTSYTPPAEVASRSPVATVPVTSPVLYTPAGAGYSAAPAGGGEVSISIEQNFSGGNIGSLKEVRDLAKEAGIEGAQEGWRKAHGVLVASRSSGGG